LVIYDLAIPYHIKISLNHHTIPSHQTSITIQSYRSSLLNQLTVPFHNPISLHHTIPSHQTSYNMSLLYTLTIQSYNTILVCHFVIRPYNTILL